VLALGAAPASAAPATAALRASEDAVDALIARGRSELEAGRAAAAQTLFEEAASKDQNSLRTRQWVIRSWMSQGRINDSMAAVDELRKQGATGPAIDYLQGMAFALKGRTYLQQNVERPVIEMSFVEAVGSLEKATKADPELYRDAFFHLSEAAWNIGEFEVAREAAEQALRVQPTNAEAALMIGRIALQQFAMDQPNASRQQQADINWEKARAAFTKAIELYGKPQGAAAINQLARAHVDLGHTYKWKEQLDPAAEAYGHAIGLDPSLVNFSQVLGAIGPERFLVAMENGAREFAERFGTKTNADASVLWWLGWARYDQKQFAKADEAFSAAVAKSANFTNSWFYIALARYHQQNYDGALTALRRNWEENGSDLIASIGANRDLNLAILDYLVGWCARGGRLVDAAILSEVQAGVVPQHSIYWNNVGLFYRDAGEPLMRSARPGDQELAKEYFEKSYKAYSTALELSPEDPAYLNDTAVLLHYYLRRETEKAKAMYKKATERAEAELAKADLPADRRELYRIALRDSKHNLEKLEKGEVTQ
jgi:tetratricopeptide (TPR) repeat protein